ncbi:hypothetical protein SLEP1_g55876 [Rubroshorea leprosula]|uniref:PGG domain-containing protein n=1 Tax=Rubroshorea leprosula TaxID=152421 RepID=A0AAV5MIY8_9ROSI|nr:hypothetical protein SLEP1_g55876 [Rubroshorea leprosula]
MIVPEVLKEDNYQRWCIFMKHYLVAQDLWDVVVLNKMRHAHGEDPKKWNQRNALALHAIKISCGEAMFDKIKEMNSAKDAWKALADLHRQPNDNGNEDTGFRTFERKQAITLLKHIKKGASDAVKKHFVEHQDTVYLAALRTLPPALEDRSTLLHVAIAAGQVKLAKELISMMFKKELEIQNKRGQTALSWAACKGSRKIVECLVEKNKRLLEIPDCEKKIPLVLACVSDHIGLDLLRKFPDLTFHKSSLEPTPVISVLEVERIVPRFYREHRNKNDETPLEVFGREHEGLLKEAQIWVKETVNFAAIIGVLLIGIMFAAAITVPGGNNDQDGYPNFSKRASFGEFLTWDQLSFYFAALSVLYFLHIHESGLTKEDFLTGHFTAKLTCSFYFLFWSIGSMLLSFRASVELLLPDNSTLQSTIFSAVFLGGPYVYIFLKHFVPLREILVFRIF